MRPSGSPGPRWGWPHSPRSTPCRGGSCPPRATSGRRAGARRAGGAVTHLAQTHPGPAQTLLASDIARRLCRRPPVPPDPITVRDQLLTLGERPWQAELTAGPLAAALGG